MISFLLRLISICAWMFFALLVSILISFLRSSNSVLDVVLGIIVIGSLAALNVLIALKLWRASSPSKNDDAIVKISSPHPAKNVDTQPEPLEEIPSVSYTHLCAEFFSKSSVLFLKSFILKMCIRDRLYSVNTKER